MIAAEKSQFAKALADAHRFYDPGIVRIIRLVADSEHDSHEPVKLLEVNPDTSPSGIVPIAFGADPPRVPFPSVVVEVTEREFQEINSGGMLLPDGWRLGETLYPSTNQL
jgi:hypothetical protein